MSAYLLHRAQSAETHVSHLKAEIDTLRTENERLKSFARRIIGTSAFEGNDLDGSYVQMLAENRELITRCIYDPERHGPSEYAEPGDNFYEFAPILCGPTLSEPAQ